MSAYLRVRELESGDGEHDLANGDDEVLRHDPQHVHAVLRGQHEGVEARLVAQFAVAAHEQGAHAALLDADLAGLLAVHVGPAECLGLCSLAWEALEVKRRKH